MNAILAWFYQDKKEGYIDIEGHIVIPPKYQRASHFDKGLATVELEGQSFYIDKCGREFREY